MGWQALLFMRFPRQVYWSGLSFHSPRGFPHQGLNLHLLHYLVGSLTWSHLGGCIIIEHNNVSGQFSHSVTSDSLWPHGLWYARLPCPSPALGAYSSSCLSSWWCHLTISSSVVPFSSCLQSFPASGSFQMSQFFTSGCQSIGVSASAWVFPMNIQDWFPLGWTGWISLQSKGLSRVFSNTTVQNTNSSVFSFLYSPTLTSIHDCWKNHS